MKRKSRARRVLGVIGAVVGTTVVFVSGTAAAAVLHLDVPATRRLVATQLTNVLHHQFKGEVAVERIGHLGIFGVSGVRVSVTDPQGVRVLHVDGAHAKVGTLALARSALFGKGPIRIPVEDVGIDHVDAAIDADPSGKGLRLATAFEPLKEPEPHLVDQSKSRGVRVEAPSVGLRHAWVHGAPAEGAPAIDAEIHDLVAKAQVDPEATEAEIVKVGLVARDLPPRGGALRGAITAHAKLPTEGQPVVSGTFDGDVLGARTTADARMDGQRVDARLDIVNVTAGELRHGLGEVPLAQPATLHAEAHGDLPHVSAAAHAQVGAGVVDVDAAIDTGTTTMIRATTRARHVDLKAILASAPQSDLGLDARGGVAIGGGLHGEIAVDTLPGTLEGDAVPPAKLHATIAPDAISASARISDDRLPTDITVAKLGDVVEARIDARAPELHRLPKIGRLVSGTAKVHGEGRLDLETKTFAARAEVTGARIAQGAKQIDQLLARARASGTIDRPIVDADVHLTGVHVGLEAKQIDAQARVQPSPELVVTDAQVDVQQNGVTAEIKAGRIAIGKRMAVEDASIAGLGEPLKLAMTKDARELRVIADTEGLDLHRVAALLGKEGTLKDGRLVLHGDVALHDKDATGEVHLAVDRLATDRVRGGAARVDARILGRDVDVTMRANLGQDGEIELTTREIAIGGAPMDPASWAHARGTVDLKGHVDLGRVADIVPPESLPFGELRGRLVVAGHASRKSPNEPPDVSLSLYTLGLVAAAKTDIQPPHDGTRVRGPAPWRTMDLDVEADLRTHAQTNQGELALRFVDRKGAIAALDMKASVPFDAILRDPSRAVAEVESAPMRVKLVLPKRALDALPTVLGTKSYAGTVEAELDVEGTALDPRVDFTAHLRGAKGAALPLDKTADSDVVFRYDGKNADLGVQVATGGKKVLDLAAHADAVLADALHPKPGKELAWDGRARVVLDGLPLEALDPIASRHVRGTLSGEANLDGLHQDAALHAQFESKDLKIGRAHYKNLTAKVDAANGAFDAHARLEQTDGYADVRAKAAMSWGARVAPELDRTKPIEAAIDAKAFRVAAAQPFLKGILEGLDGRLDANANAKLGPGPGDVQMQGKVALRDGTMHITAIGEELRDARFTVTLAPDGTVKLQDFAAKGIEGELSGDAQAKLRGFGLESALANFHIPDKKPLDVTVQGTPIGRIHGDVHVKANATPDMSKVTVNVDVPTLGVELPQSMKNGVQDLAKEKDVRVGTFRTQKDFVELPLNGADLEKNDTTTAKAGGTTLDLAVHIGEATIVRGNQARVVLGGDPHIVVTDKARVTGQIHLKEGKVDVQGKEFEIDKGTVTFQPDDPGNPIIVATAAWTAEDGTKVFADFVGPVKTGKVELRSEPPRPKNEILALVLFGTADGMNGVPPPPGRQPDGTTRAATAVGGGFAAQGLTEALDDLTGVQASARIDTTHSDNPRPEVEIQVAKAISVEFAHVLGTPPISQPDTNYATLDWRFKRNWSLETTVGDRGSAMVDAVWQKRY
ncbi:MAG TPA: translocation/assembly module TamB domain-containing protein [Labilithrix sp.]